MLTKIPVLARNGIHLSRTAVRCMSGYGTPSDWKPDHVIDDEHFNTMNHLPVPSGSWQENYNKRNSKWNMQIAVATGFLFLTVGVMYKFGCFYLHDQPDYKKIKIDNY